MEYKVTIIMGIYNCASTLHEAIDSLLNQTFKEWKLIMCDDCSSDNTYQIAQYYVNKYDNMMLLHNDKNMGLNYTLNYCLKYVDTKYVARMDGDDVSLPSRLEKEYDFLESHDEYAIVSTNMTHFDENGDWGKGFVVIEPKKEDFVKDSPFSHAPCMVKTEAYRKVNGYSEGKYLLRLEDYHLWYKMYLQGYKGYNIDETLYKMRDDRNAMNRRKYKYRINEAYVKYLILRDFNLKFYNYVYVIKPLIVGLLPQSVYTYLHKKRLNHD